MNLSVLAQSIVSGIAIGALYGLIGLGFTLTYRTTKIINFAQGDLVSLGAYVTFWGLSLNFPLLGAIILGMIVVGVGMGVVERLALRPLYKYGTVYPIFATVGLSIAIESIIRLLWGPLPEFIPSILSPNTFPLGSVLISPRDIGIFVIGIVVALGVIAMLDRTKLGRGMRTVAQDRDVAALLGINADRLFFLSFVISGALAALVGGLIGPMTGLNSTMGIPLGLAGFTAAVLGGLGNAPGALIGGIVLSVAENLVVLYITPDYKDAVAYGLLLLMLLLRPQGFFGEETTAMRQV